MCTSLPTEKRGCGAARRATLRRTARARGSCVLRRWPSAYFGTTPRGQSSAQAGSQRTTSVRRRDIAPVRVWRTSARCQPSSLQKEACRRGEKVKRAEFYDLGPLLSEDPSCGFCKVWSGWSVGNTSGAGRSEDVAARVISSCCSFFVTRGAPSSNDSDGAAEQDIE